MIKKIFAVLSALTFAFAFGCGKKEETDVKAQPKETETTAASSEAQSGSIGTMSYTCPGDWVMEEINGQVTYTIPDGSGAIIMQLTDGSMFTAETEDELITLLAEQSVSAWESIEGAEITYSDWNDTAIEGKKCYVINYTYELNGVSTYNASYFFANYNDTAKDLITITGMALTEGVLLDEEIEDVLETAVFS